MFNRLISGLRPSLRSLGIASLMAAVFVVNGPTSPQFEACLSTSHGCGASRNAVLGNLDSGISNRQSPAKHACASLPVDFKRAAASQALAAPRVRSNVVAASAFQLHSRPGATKVIYLDFDGAVTQNTPWNSASAPKITTTAYDSDSSPSTFSSAELANILEIWQRIAECYSPFDVDVTTEAPAVADLIDSGGSDSKWGVRVLFGTPNPSPAPGSGGVAYVGGFGWNYGTGVDVPCFVLQPGVGTYPKYNADAAVHEIGHTLGLSHDGQFPASSSKHVEYYEGQGSGKVAWAPHLGAGYYVPFVQWSKGEYANPSNTEDDLNIIVTQNGFGYRPDDFASAQSAASSIPGAAGTGTFNVNVSGVIETRADTDWFKFNAAAGPVKLNAVGGPANSMLDIQLSLYNSSGSLITTVNPPDDIIASLSTTVAAGTYYVKIEGVALGDPLTTGYTDYSSVGQYSISGTYPTSSAVAAAPVLGGANNQYYGVSQLPKNINLGITVADSDSPTLASATVKITNVVPSQDVLQAVLKSATTGNITSSYDSSTGTLTLTSAGATATVAQFQAALRSVAYSNSSSSPSLTPRNVQFQVSDGTNPSNILTSVITIGYFYVAANYNASTKTLTLTDDVGDNAVSITLSGTQLTVTGSGPTRIGTAASSQTSVTFPFNSDVKIVGNFSGGSDSVKLSGVRSSNSTFIMGNGNDSVSFTLCTITNLTVDGGNGTDTVSAIATLISSKAYTSVP